MAIQNTSNDPRIEAATQAIAAQRQMKSTSGAVADLRRNVRSMQEGVLAAMITLATGGSKAEAALSGVGTAITTKIMGPLGAFVGLSYTALVAVKNLATGFSQMGVQGAGGVETVVNQMRTLLRGLEAARERVKQNRAFANQTNFGFKDVVAGDKALQSFTKGALNTRAGLQLTGDAAAVAGTQFESMAVNIGQAYDGMASGRPIGGVLAELQKLGVISGQTRNALEAMQASGASFSDMWRVFEGDLKRSRGAMENAGKTLEGLQSTFEDAKETMMSGFGQGFLEGEKTAVRSMTAAVERLTPVTDYYGRILGKLIGVQTEFQSKVMDTATSIPGMETVLKGVGTAFLALNAAIVGTALFKGLGMGLGTAAGALGGANKRITRTEGGYKIGKESETKDKIRGDLAAAGSAAGEAFKLALAGAMGNAFSALLQGVGRVVAAFRSGGLTASVMVVGGAFRFLWAQVRGLGAALLSNPITLTLAAAATVGWMVWDSWTKAKEAVEAYTSATDEVIGRLRSQAGAIQTVQDLSKAYADTMRELGQAHEEAARAAVAGDAAMENAARGRIASLRTQQMALEKVNRAGLKRPDEVYERQSSQREDARAAGAYRRDTQQELMGNEAKLQDMKAQRREIEAQANAAQMLYEGLLQVQDAQAATGDTTAAAASKFAQMQGEMARLQDEIATVEGQLAHNEDPWRGFVEFDQKALEAKLKSLQSQLETLRGGMDEVALSAQQVGQSLRVALESDNELAILQAKLALYDTYQSTLENVAAARLRLAEMEKDGSAAEAAKRGAASDLFKAQSDQAALEKMAGASGVTLGPGGAGQKAMTEARVRELRNLADEQQKVTRLAAQDRAIAQQALEVWRSRRQLELEVAEQIAAATDNAYEAELKRLELAEQRIALDQQEAESKARLIENESASRAKALRKGGMTKEAQSVESAGKDAASATRKQASEEAELRRQANRAAKEAFQRDQARQRAQSQAALAAGQMDVAAVAQRRAGNLAGAQSLEESAARTQDEAERGGLERRYRDQGMGEEDARAAADTEITTRAQRREQGREEETRQAGYAQSESSGRNAAEALRTTAIQAEVRGHLDYADALREAATRTEKAATLQQRVTDMMQREGINREQAEAKVKKADAEEQQQRGLEFEQRKKKRDLAKEGVMSENKARRADMGGNEERAARIRDKQTAKERTQALKEQGFGEEEARKQARREQRDERRRRRQDRANEEAPENKPDLRMRASTLRRVGGGGNAYGAGSHASTDLFSRIDRIIKHLQGIHHATTSSRNLFSARVKF